MLQLPTVEELEILELVARRLEEAKLPYMVTGSMALAFYTQPRMTRDVDLVVALSAPGAAVEIVRRFQEDFLFDEDGVRRAVREQGMFNLIHIESCVKVDCIVRKSDPYRQEEFQRRRRMKVRGDGELWVVAPEDLILSKLAWAQDSGSETQLRDVRLLVTFAGLDRAYLERWAASLGVKAKLSEVMA